MAADLTKVLTAAGWSRETYRTLQAWRVVGLVRGARSVWLYIPAEASAAGVWLDAAKGGAAAVKAAVADAEAAGWRRGDSRRGKVELRPPARKNPPKTPASCDAAVATKAAASRRETAARKRIARELEGSSKRPTKRQALAAIKRQAKAASKLRLSGKVGEALKADRALEAALRAAEVAGWGDDALQAEEDGREAAAKRNPPKGRGGKRPTKRQALTGIKSRAKLAAGLRLAGKVGEAMKADRALEEALRAAEAAGWGDDALQAEEDGREAAAKRNPPKRKAAANPVAKGNALLPIVPAPRIAWNFRADRSASRVALPAWAHAGRLPCQKDVMAHAALKSWTRGREPVRDGQRWSLSVISTGEGVGPKFASRAAALRAARAASKAIGGRTLDFSSSAASKVADVQAWIAALGRAAR